MARCRSCFPGERNMTRKQEGFEMLNGSKLLMLRTTLVGLLAAGLGFAAHPKLSPELEGVDAQKQVDVIVTYRDSPAFSHHAKVLVRGGSVRRSLEVVKGGAYRRAAGKVAGLVWAPDVEY